MWIAAAATDAPFLLENLPKEIHKEMVARFYEERLPHDGLRVAGKVLCKYGSELKKRAEKSKDETALAVAERLISIAISWCTSFNPGTRQ